MKKPLELESKIIADIENFYSSMNDFKKGTISELNIFDL